MKNRACKSCRFSHAVIEDIDRLHHMECRRSAPGTITREGQPVFWPTVWPDDWCGEYAPATNQPEIPDSSAREGEEG